MHNHPICGCVCVTTSEKGKKSEFGEGSEWKDKWALLVAPFNSSLLECGPTDVPKSIPGFLGNLPFFTRRKCICAFSLTYKSGLPGDSFSVSISSPYVPLPTPSSHSSLAGTMELLSPEDGETDEYHDGTVRLRNPHIELMDQDILYHLALGSESHDLVEMFQDTKFVCIGGTPQRMQEFAYFIKEEIGHRIPTGTQLHDISQFSYRYAMYKIGPVLSISHGMGMPSAAILLHEVIKLMYHAKVIDPIFFRIGTCGGVGVDGGNVIITEEALNSDLKPYHELTVLGKKIRRASKLDKRLCDELLSLARERDDPYDTCSGKTMCTDDFYEGQGRLDGAFCDYSEKEKMSYIHHLNLHGVTNIEMESLAFAALTHHAGIRAAVVCVSLLDRLKGDQVLAGKDVMNEWQLRPQKLVARYIKKHLGLLSPSRNKSPMLSTMACACPHSSSVRVKSPRRMNMVQQESESYD